MTTAALLETYPDFFDLKYVGETAPEVEGLEDAALWEFVLAPDNPTPPAPNCIFDVHHTTLMRARYGLVGVPNPIVAFIAASQAGDRSCNALFDDAYYRQQVKGVSPEPLGAVIHALKHMDSGKVPFSPFVDVDHVAAGIGRERSGALVRGILGGSLQVEAPHPLIDVGFIRSNAEPRLETLHDVVRHYWSCGEDLSTHPLFDVDYYKDQLPDGEQVVHAVYHYLISRNAPSPHALFDEAFYRASLQDRTGEAPRRAFEHYLTTGQALGISPSPYFEVDFYRRQAGDVAQPLLHYISQGHRFFAPHPMISASDAQLLARTTKEKDLPVAQRLAQDGASVSMAVTPEFVPEYYQRQIENAEMSPEQLRHHFFSEGYPSGARPNGLLSLPFIDEQCIGLNVQARTPLAAYFENGWNARDRILIALTSMDDTAGNRAWLEFCRGQAKTTGVEMLVASVRPGALSNDFFKVAHVWHFAQEPIDALDDGVLRRSVGKLQMALRTNLPKVAFVEADAHLALLKDLSALQVPLVAISPDGFASLSEEALALLSRATLLAAMNFEAPAFADGGDTDVDLPERVAGFHTYLAGRAVSEAQRDASRAALGLGEDDVLIVSSGGSTIEHGADLFGALAAQCFDDAEFPETARFLWHGPGRFFGNRPKFYAQHFARTSTGRGRFDMRDDISRSDAFAAADIYIKLGRDGCDLADVAEAQSAGLPVLVMEGPPFAAYFEKVGGAVLFDAFDLRAARGRLREWVSSDAVRDTLGQRARFCASEHFGLSGFVARVSDVVCRIAPDFAPLNGAESITGRLLLAFSDKDRFEHISENLKCGVDANLGAAAILTADQITEQGWPAPLQTSVAATRCGEVVLAHVADPSVLDAAAYDAMIWVTEGEARELGPLYDHGLTFWEIYSTRGDQISEMRDLNPRIADKMQLVTWSAP